MVAVSDVSKPGSVLDEMVFAVSVERARVLEERLRMIVRPKPRWLPEFIWRRVLARLLYIEHSG